MSTRLEQISASPTLATALEWLDSAELGDGEKRDLRSAVQTACRWFGKKGKPDEVPADPAALRGLFRMVPAGAVGRSKKRRANVKWGLGRLLKLMGVGSGGAHRTPLIGHWKQTVDVVSDEYARVLLGRLGRFCSGRMIEPRDVCDAILGEYLLALEQELRVSKPRRVHRETIRLWNRNVEHNPLWPRHLRPLTLPSYSQKYVLAWAAFPPSLSEDVERFLSRQATTDPFDLSTPIHALKPSLIETYKDRLLRFASCLALTGTDPAELRSRSDLVQIDGIKRALGYLAKGRGRKLLAAAVGTVLVKVARDLGCPEDEVNAIAEIARRLRGKRKNLCRKVRDRLAPLKHEGNLARLFLLPTGLMRRLARISNPVLKDAQLFQLALALALLTVCPLRVGSLCSLRMDRHFNWSAGPMTGDLIIEFDEGELKEDEPASFPIPREVASLIRTYWTKFRPLQDPQDSPFLFCGRDPTRPRHKGGFSTLLTRLVFEKMGLWVNPHLYRHIVHLVVLRKFPGAYAMVARVLTHRSIATTIQNYSHFDGELAMRAYQRLVEGVKGSASNDGPDLDAVAYNFDREDRIHVRR